MNKAESKAKMRRHDVTLGEMRKFNIYIDYGETTPIIGGTERFDDVMRGCCVIGHIRTIDIKTTTGDRVIQTTTYSHGMYRSGVRVDWLLLREHLTAIHESRTAE